jgi:DNA-binding response OmpR family regulator
MLKKDFLVVDDEPAICEMMAGALEDAGYTVDVAITATEATDLLLHGCRYDIAVVDWQLPDGDGVTIANLAAQIGSQAFVMSGHLAEMSSSAIDLRQTLMKPVRPSVLLAAARAYRQGRGHGAV